MINIRIALVNDSPAISGLLQQLGYHRDQRSIAETLAQLPAHPDSQVFVAERGEALCDVISLHVLPLFHLTGKLGRITALVVDDACRGEGIGTQLINRAETWFKEQSCRKIEVTSGDHRTDAHRFYQRHGLDRDGQRLSKILPDPGQ